MVQRTGICLMILITFMAQRAHGTQPKSQPQPALALEQLLEIALGHDVRVRVAYAQLDVYRAKYDQAKWAAFPQTKLTALLGGPVGERKLKCPDDPACVQLKNNDGTGLGDLSNEVSFAVGGKLETVLPLYTFGKLSSVKQAAKAGIKAGKADIQRIRQQVAIEIRRAWYAWLLACSAVEVLDDGVDKLALVEKKLRKMLDSFSEEVTQRDLFKLRYNASQVGLMLSQAKKGKALALAAIRFLTGIEELGTGRALQETGIKKPDINIEKRQFYLAQAHKRRPELRLLQAAQQAAQADLQLRKASFYPDIFLAGFVEGSYSPAHDYIDNSLLNRGLTYYSGGLSLGMAITFDIPQKIARQEEAQAKLTQIQLQAQQAKSAIALEIDKRIEELRTARQNLATLRKGHRAAKAWMRSNMMSYGVGLANTKDMLDSLAAYAKSKIDYDKSIVEMMLAKDNLDAAIGEKLISTKSN